MIAIAKGLSRRNRNDKPVINSSYVDKSLVSKGRNTRKKMVASKSQGAAEFEKPLLAAMYGHSDAQSNFTLKQTIPDQSSQSKMYFVERDRSHSRKRKKTTIITTRKNRDGSRSKEKEVIY